MKKWNILLGSIILAAGMTACQQEKPDTAVNTEQKPTNEVVTEETAQPSAEVETPETESAGVTVTYVSEPRTSQAEDGSDLINGYLRYPVVTVPDNEALSDTINAAIKKETEGFTTTYDNYVSQAQSEYVFATENPVDGEVYFNPYYLSLSIDLERNDGKILSLTEMTEDYTGGAHGNHNKYGLTFDMKDGKKLALSDLSDKPEDFRTEVLDGIKEIAKTEAYSQRLDQGYEANLESMLLEDGKWYLANDGIHFFANPYELGCYAAGTIEFVESYEDLKGLSEAYAFTGNYEKRVPVGEQVEKDINGDGKTEKILYKAIEAEDYSSVDYVFTVDDKDFSDQIALEFPDMEAYYLVDLDSTDSYIEIAIQDYGASDDNTTTFYRYDTDGTIKSLGSISDLWSSSGCYLQKDCKMIARGRLSILQTWFAPFTFELDKNGTIQEVELDTYYPDARFIYQNPILQDVTVYTQRDLKSETVVLTPDDGPVSFTATDNKNWVEFKTKDGKTYYLYMTELSQIKSGDKNLEVTEVFANLVFAD